MRKAYSVRPVYIPSTSENSFVDCVDVRFEWFGGFSLIQKQRCINSLHKAFQEKSGVSNILEISSKSPNNLGVKSSAFNLSLALKNRKYSIECIYQASKVFENGGPFLDIMNKTSMEAKKDIRLKNSGKLKKFNFEYIGIEWSLDEGFYDWLYLNGLQENQYLGEEICRYEAFTDIAFNPKKSVNCQAFSAAMFVFLKSKNINFDILDFNNTSEYKKLYKMKKSYVNSLF